MAQRPEKPPPMKRVGDVVWEIDPSYKEGMRVPARIYATETLIKQMDPGVFEQTTNVACLPGIQRFAFCMPDGHWGYGFPIGGVAAFSTADGIISPGGIGFDINCLAGGTKILTEHGYYRKIEDMESEWVLESLRCLSFNKKEEQKTNIIRFIKIKPDNKIFKIITAAGHEIIATADHPIWTPSGMICAKDLKEGDRLAIYPFNGVKFERPGNDVIVSRESIASLNLPWKKSNIIKELEKRDLLPLRRDSPLLAYLIKILAYNIGDGSLIIVGKERKGFAWFWGKKEDLEIIRSDIKKLGYTPSKVYTRERSHTIDTKHGTIKFSATEYSMSVTSRAFVALLHALGAPIGKKAIQQYLIPEWLMRSSLWHKRLFLASMFGAEMSKPKTMSAHNYNFYMPAMSVDKISTLVDNGKAFLKQIAAMLEDFGIKSAEISERPEYLGRDGLTYRIRLLINADSSNLRKLYEVIGFEYNKKKKFLANVAAQYLRLKESVIEQRLAAQRLALAMRKDGTAVTEICHSLASTFVNKRFLIRSWLEGRKTSPRIAASFPTFDVFVKNVTEGLGESGAVWDEIRSKEEIKFNGFVYDFTVDHADHNFIASNFIVSNCGLRLLKTNLTVKDIQPKLKELVDVLFKTVPAGVGSRGFVSLTPDQFRDVMRNGVDWCIESGYGWKRDRDRIEESGHMPGGDPAKISDKAISRGVNQLGTLGSGNHFLEIEVVDKIFDPAVAKIFGITEPGQICVMIHTGSRGFGHQVATDYLRVFDMAIRKYGITVRDRELVCAPCKSPEGQDYYAAMVCAANNSFSNRQVITHRVREGFEKVFGQDAEAIGLDIIYDVPHNIAKIEKYTIDGKETEVCVHRKGATRCFGPGRPEVPGIYRATGQPVIVGGSMETGSFLLVGTEKAMAETFGSTAHGSGRTMSRAAAKRQVWGAELKKKMEAAGIIVRCVSMSGLAEEAGIAYKVIDDVVNTMETAGISRKIAFLRPIANIKG